MINTDNPDEILFEYELKNYEKHQMIKIGSKVYLVSNECLIILDYLLLTIESLKLKE